jgi:hypothetical protein
LNTRNVIGDSFKRAMATSKIPKSEDDISSFIVSLIRKCDEIGITDYGLSPNQIGRCRGDWFELGIETILKCFLKTDEFRAYPGRGHKIKEIKGFEEVSWIPMPDVIFKSTNDLRGILTLKWGMRHDRMYEAGYEAYAIKDWCKRAEMREPVIFLVTNDNFSGFESRLLTMSRCPVIDGVYYLNHESLPSRIKNKIKSMNNLICDVKQIVQESRKP